MAITRNENAKNELISDHRMFTVPLRDNFMLPPLRSKNLQMIVSNEERLQRARKMKWSKLSNRCRRRTGRNRERSVIRNKF